MGQPPLPPSFMKSEGAGEGEAGEGGGAQQREPPGQSLPLGCRLNAGPT